MSGYRVPNKPARPIPARIVACAGTMNGCWHPGALSFSRRTATHAAESQRPCASAWHNARWPCDYRWHRSAPGSHTQNRPVSNRPVFSCHAPWASIPARRHGTVRQPGATARYGTPLPWHGVTTARTGCVFPRGVNTVSLYPLGMPYAGVPCATATAVPTRLPLLGRHGTGRRCARGRVPCRAILARVPGVACASAGRVPGVAVAVPWRGTGRGRAGRARAVPADVVPAAGRGVVATGGGGPRLLRVPSPQKIWLRRLEVCVVCRACRSE